MTNKPSLYSKKITVQTTGQKPNGVSRKSNLPQPITYDLSQNLSLFEMAKKLERSINAPLPSSCFFIWGAKRQVQRQELDLEHQRILLEQIRTLELTAEQMAQTQAALFLMPETIEAIIENKRTEFEFIRREFSDKLNQIEERAKERKINLDLLEDNYERQKTVTGFIKKALGHVDLENMSQSLQTFITQVILSPNMGGYTPTEMLDELNKLVVQEKKYTVDKTKSEAQKAKQQAELEKLAVEKEYEREGKKPAGFKIDDDDGDDDK